MESPSKKVKQTGGRAEEKFDVHTKMTKVKSVLDVIQPLNIRVYDFVEQCIKDII